MKRATNVFQTGDLYEAFTAEGFNQRTRNAFEHGVKAAANGNPLIYQDGARDYADAELFGYQIAEKRLSNGHRWQCRECGHIHDRKAKP